MDNRSDVSPSTPSPEDPKVLEFDPIRLSNFEQRLKDEQNLPLGLIAGAVAALAGAILWAVITVVTEYRIGWMAIGIGFLVGFAIRWAGRGVDRVFGIAGAGLALLSCLSGNFLSSAIFISQIEAIPLLDVLFFFLRNPGAVIEIIGLTFLPIDLLFYGLALYEGYKFSFRRVSQAEMKALLRERPQYP